MKNKRILIADDHSAIRKGLKHILSGELVDPVFGEATTGPEIRQMIKKGPWDLMILDINIPGDSGLDILKYIKAEKLKLPTLVFSLHKEYQVAVRALRSGAYGYISKDSSDEELIKAITQILSGKIYISQAVADILVTQIDTPEDKLPHEKLSDREFQTLLLLASGKTVSEIARELSLSISSLNTYRSRILDKMNLRNNSDLISYAVRNNLI
jgi:two-component system, NarL family, invasion response regulator UvrY